MRAPPQTSAKVGGKELGLACRSGPSTSLPGRCGKLPTWADTARPGRSAGPSASRESYRIVRASSKTRRVGFEASPTDARRSHCLGSCGNRTFALLGLVLSIAHLATDIRRISASPPPCFKRNGCFAKQSGLSPRLGISNDGSESAKGKRTVQPRALVGRPLGRRDEDGARTGLPFMMVR